MSKINGIETEWTQLQRKMGNLPEVEEEEEEINEDDYKSAQQLRFETFEAKSLQQLNEAEDDLHGDDEEQMFEMLRRKRLMEMKQKASKAKYKGVYEISASEYVNEVCKTDDDSYVVVHLFAPGLEECKVLDQIFLELATRHPYTKFVKIKGNAAIPNFPDRNCPTVLIYQKGKMIKQWIGLVPFGGLKKISADNVEWRLHQYRVVQSELTEAPSIFVDDDDSILRKPTQGTFNFVGNTYAKSAKSRRYTSDEEEDDEEDDY